LPNRQRVAGIHSEIGSEKHKSLAEPDASFARQGIKAQRTSDSSDDL
jgi:hypothetical protein